MDVASRVAEVVSRLEPPPSRVLEVGTGSRFDVTQAVQQALPDADVIVSDKRAPDPPDPLVGIALDLTADEPPDGVDVVVAVRLPPERWRHAEALAARSEAVLVLVPLTEESVPDRYDQRAAGVYVTRPRRAP